MIRKDQSRGFAHQRLQVRLARLLPARQKALEAKTGRSAGRRRSVQPATHWTRYRNHRHALFTAGNGPTETQGR